jgi:hypothetical protein
MLQVRRLAHYDLNSSRGNLCSSDALLPLYNEHLDTEKFLQKPEGYFRDSIDSCLPQSSSDFLDKFRVYFIVLSLKKVLPTYKKGQ